MVTHAFRQVSDPMCAPDQLGVVAKISYTTTLLAVTLGSSRLSQSLVVCIIPYIQTLTTHSPGGGEISKSAMQTRSNLLATKAIRRRLAVQSRIPLCNCFLLVTASNLQQALPNHMGNTDLSLAGGGCWGLPNSLQAWVTEGLR